MNTSVQRTSDEAMITLSPQAVAIQFDATSLRVQLADGRELSAPPRLVSTLAARHTRAAPELGVDWER